MTVIYDTSIPVKSRRYRLEWAYGNSIAWGSKGIGYRTRFGARLAAWWMIQTDPGIVTRRIRIIDNAV